jgi:hypothetical protein
VPLVDRLPALARRGPDPDRLEQARRVQARDRRVHRHGVAFVVGVQPPQLEVAPLDQFERRVTPPLDQLAALGQRRPDLLDRMGEPPLEADLVQPVPGL